MNFALEQAVTEIFALAAEAKAEKRRDEEMKAFYETLDHEKREKSKVKEKEEKEAKEAEEALATAAQIAAFNERLDDFDTKTVHALMENGEALDKVRDDMRTMRDDAYVLPDGRRVFKTQDGQRVFDEHGTAVGRDLIDPQIIEDRHTKWEPFKAAKDTESKLQTERQDLLDYQAKLDEARSRANKGDMSKKDLDALGADLEANAPPAVRQKLGIGTPQTGETLNPRNDDLSARHPLIDDPSRRAQPRPAPM